MLKKFFFTSMLFLLFAGCKTAVSCDCTCNDNNNGGGSTQVVYTSGTTKYPGVEDSVPRVGKIYYSDGSVREFYNSAKTPVGIVAFLKADGSVKAITGLYSNIRGLVYSDALTYVKNYDAGCDFHKGKWQLLSRDDAGELYSGFEYIRYGFDQLIAGGYTGEVFKFGNSINMWVQKGNSDYYLYHTAAGTVDSTSMNSTLFAKVFLFL